MQLSIAISEQCTTTGVSVLVTVAPAIASSIVFLVIGALCGHWVTNYRSQHRHRKDYSKQTTSGSVRKDVKVALAQIQEKQFDLKQNAAYEPVQFQNLRSSHT